MSKSALAISLTTMVTTLCAPPALAQSNGQKLGNVNFETSCKPEAQKLFNTGMLYQHSFCIAPRKRPSRMC